MATLTLDTKRKVLILSIKGEGDKYLRAKDPTKLVDIYHAAKDLADGEPETIPDYLNIHTTAASQDTTLPNVTVVHQSMLERARAAFRESEKLWAFIDNDKRSISVAIPKPARRVTEEVISAARAIVPSPRNALTTAQRLVATVEAVNELVNDPTFGQMLKTGYLIAFDYAGESIAVLGYTDGDVAASIFEAFDKSDLFEYWDDPATQAAITSAIHDSTPVPAESFLDFQSYLLEYDRVYTYHKETHELKEWTEPF